MATQETSTTRRRKDRNDKPARAGEALGLALVMWLVPLALFSYVAFKVAVATGLQIPEWLANFDFRTAAIITAVVFLVVAAVLVLVPALSPRRQRRAGPWDNKTSPGHTP